MSEMFKMPSARRVIATAGGDTAAVRARVRNFNVIRK